MVDIPNTLQDIERMIASQTQESLHLDYKDSRAIDRSRRGEIAKDVSAFANSDGGLIIFGVSEQDHLPVDIDEGTDDLQYSREWLEQIINSNVSPRIEGIRIIPIPKSTNRSVYAVAIPKSYRGHHQAPDKKYYKRFNFQSEPMEDYEISDIRNRRSVVKPLMNVDVEMRHGVMVLLIVENRGSYPARDVVFSFPNGITWPRDDEIPRLLSQGARVVPPGRKYQYFYHSYIELVNSGIPTTLDIEVSYFHPEAGERINDAFYIDFMDFFRAAVIHSEIEDLEKVIKDGLRDLSGEIRKLKDVLNTISDIAAPTGITLSRQTLENLSHVVSQDGLLEKLNPYTSSHSVFQEVLGIDFQLAWNLHLYFEQRSEAKSLREVAGLTDDILAKLRENFSVNVEDA